MSPIILRNPLVVGLANVSVKIDMLQHPRQSGQGRKDFLRRTTWVFTDQFGGSDLVAKSDSCDSKNKTNPSHFKQGWSPPLEQFSTFTLSQGKAEPKGNYE